MAKDELFPISRRRAYTNVSRLVGAIILAGMITPSGPTLFYTIGNFVIVGIALFLLTVDLVSTD